MSILYDVPRIGERRNFGQQGPTCWYYAAKMLLKFHGMTQKGSEIYEGLKELHQVRRVLTDLDFDTKAETKAELEKRERFFDKLPEIIRKLESRGSLFPSQKEQLAYLKNKRQSAREDRPRIQRAIQALDRCIDRGLDRLELLTRFVPTAGFTKIEQKFWEGEDKLEEVLKSWGPIYTGGSVSSLSTQRTTTNRQTRSGDRVIEVREFKARSSHAIVLVGIVGNSVYYKDPNKTDELRTISKTTFYNHLHADTNDFMIGIFCSEGLREVGNYMQCIHMRMKIATLA
ncbi:MAG TPA: hypothetical protein VG672_18985 [Bryobacteraceae bacterium]|nr:hypothetical protein [Bryobacteraceae bacterium]